MSATSLRDVTARDLMTTDLVALDERETLGLAAEVLRRGCFRHLPVTRDGALVALLDDREVMTVLASDPWHGLLTPLERMRRHRVVRVAPESPLPLVAEALLQSSCDAVVVASDEGTLMGLITIHDLARCVAAADGQEETAP